MALFGIRFDLRNPPMAGTSTAERYRAALDMVQWADGLGFVVCVLSEHHGQPDGYLPSPLPMAAAVAARTQAIRIQIAALVSSFHDPLRLAEDVAVVDNISNGRLDLVITNGYVAEEFAMFDRPLSGRPARTVRAVEVLRAARSGEPFEYDGRTVRVTPATCQDGGPALHLGGSTEPAARRAARIGDGFMPSSAEVWTYYRDERIAAGHPDPGEWPGGDTSVIHLATDPDAGWAAIAPYAMHESTEYGRTMAAAGVDATGGYRTPTDPDALRATGQYRVLTPDQLLAEIQGKGPFGFTLFHPMFGGLPPALAWESLRLFEREVLPRLDAGPVS